MSLGHLPGGSVHFLDSPIALGIYATQWVHEFVGFIVSKHHVSIHEKSPGVWPGRICCIFQQGGEHSTTTRQEQMNPTLVALMDAYEQRSQGFIFPGRHGHGRLTRQGADWILREACGRLGLKGVSTHSFRRSFVTQMIAEGKTPAQIQRYTGHKSLGSLLHYIGA